MRRSALYLLGLLAAVNLLHFASRNVAFPLYDALRLRYGASESALGLVGTAFMVPHAITAIAVGWLGDHLDRRRVMATGIVVWSVATVAAALAPSMAWFLAARAVAGLGTAACVPVANAILCDAFPEESKARTVAVFNLGLFSGGAVGVLVGESLGFPLALWAVGLPGLLLAALVLGLDRAVSPPPAPAASRRIARPGAAPRALVGDAIEIFASSAMRLTVGGAVLMAFAAGGYLAWFVEFLHAKGLSSGQTQALFGGALLGGLLGVMAGGAIGDRFARRSRGGRHQVVALGFVLAVPCALAAIALPAGAAFGLACCLLMFFVSWYHGPVAAAVDDLAPPGRAATAQGFYIFLMHLVGTAPASYLVGVLAGRVGVAAALYLPTAIMGLAALAFVAAGRAAAGGARRSVLERVS